MLEVIDLWAGYGSTAVLRGVHLRLPRGRVLALLGANGAGKTTLIRALSGVIPIRQGRILWEGEPLNRLMPQERAKRVAVVPQARHLPASFTVEQAILLGRTAYMGWLGIPSRRDQEAVETALQETRLAALRHRLLGTLSGGEQQRVLLARALAQGAPLILLDEPTTHLDLYYQVQILQLVRRLAHEGNRAVLMVLHDPNQAARFADEVAVLHQGHIIAHGPPERVLTPDLFRKVYGLQADVLRVAGRLVILPREGT